jgi:hypothetical protein
MTNFSAKDQLGLVNRLIIRAREMGDKISAWRPDLKYFKPEKRLKAITGVSPVESS